MEHVPLADPAGDRMFQLTSGDDYQLVFTAEPAVRKVVADIFDRYNHRFTRVGTVISGRDGVFDQAGVPVEVAQKGWSHF